jgi:hypothetical protein
MTLTHNMLLTTTICLRGISYNQHILRSYHTTYTQSDAIYNYTDLHTHILHGLVMSFIALSTQLVMTYVIHITRYTVWQPLLHAFGSCICYHSLKSSSHYTITAIHWDHPNTLLFSHIYNGRMILTRFITNAVTRVGQSLVHSNIYNSPTHYPTTPLPLPPHYYTIRALYAHT